MSTYGPEPESEAEVKTESAPKSGPDSSDYNTFIREVIFTIGVLAGMTVFALGFAFFLLSVTTDTTPPAPYFATTMDRILLFVISVIALIGGGEIVRKSMSVAGW